MTTSYMLAIDAGTGSGRAVIFDENGNQIASAQHEWWHQADPRFSGSMDFDVEGNWSLLSRAIRQAIAEARIASADGRRRTRPESRRLESIIERNCRKDGFDIFMPSFYTELRHHRTKQIPQKVSRSRSAMPS